MTSQQRARGRSSHTGDRLRVADINGLPALFIHAFHNCHVMGATERNRMPTVFDGKLPTG